MRSPSENWIFNNFFLYLWWIFFFFFLLGLFFIYSIFRFIQVEECGTVVARWMIWVFMRLESPDKSQISYFLVCNYIDLFIPVAIPESDRLFNHAQSLQLAGDKGHTIWPGGSSTESSEEMFLSVLYWIKYIFILGTGRVSMVHCVKIIR